MDALLPFSIPVSGLKEGIHHFDFEVKDAFFAAFEDSILKRAEVKVHLLLDKRPSLMMLEFALQGRVETDCDRCLGAFQLPIEVQHEVMVKYAEEPSDQADVVYIRREDARLHVAKLIYDFLHLSIPMHKTHDLIHETCDPKMTAFLQNAEEQKVKESVEADEDPKGIWDALKDLKW